MTQWAQMPSLQQATSTDDRAVAMGRLPPSSIDNNRPKAVSGHFHQKQMDIPKEIHLASSANQPATSTGSQFIRH